MGDTRTVPLSTDHPEQILSAASTSRPPAPEAIVPMNHRPIMQHNAETVPIFNGLSCMDLALIGFLARKLCKVLQVLVDCLARDSTQSVNIGAVPH